MAHEEIRELINRRRRQILVHSCLYYRLNSTLWSDHQYDEKARELQKLQEQYPKIASECDFHDVFKDFTETTSGFNLPIHDPDVVRKAQRLLEYHQRRNKHIVGH